VSVFSSIGGALKKVFGVVVPEIVTAASISAPILSIFSPPLGAFVTNLGHWMGLAEAAFTTAKQGAAKKQTVAQIAVAELPMLQEFIAEFGSNAKIPQDELGKTIDAFAAAYNQAGTFIAAMKEANKPATPAK